MALSNSQLAWVAGGLAVGFIYDVRSANKDALMRVNAIEARLKNLDPLAPPQTAKKVKEIEARLNNFDALASSKLNPPQENQKSDALQAPASNLDPLADKNLDPQA